jgi:hypothetical protein
MEDQMVAKISVFSCRVIVLYSSAALMVLL